MSYTISNNRFIISWPNEESSSTPTSFSFALHSRITHLFYNCLHFLFPSFFHKSEKFVLNKNHILYINSDSFKEFEDKIKSTLLKNYRLQLSKESKVSNLPAILNALGINRFCNAKFTNFLSKQIAKAIENKDRSKIEFYTKVFRKLPPKKIREALSARDINKGVNLLAYAAHHNFPAAVALIRDAVDPVFLKEISLQRDYHHWTTLHHLALMNDGEYSYKTVKKWARIDAKTVTQFFCESPSMLRKYIRKDARKFSTSSSKQPLCLYFRNADPQQPTEEQLPFDSLMKKHASLFSREPKCFKSIPQIEASLFQTLWADMSIIGNGSALYNLSRTRNGAALAQIDAHLRKISMHGEDGLALTPVQYDDHGEKLPDDANVGIGTEARIDFAKNDVVTLYGGEHCSRLDDDDAPDYGFDFSDKEYLGTHIDGLHFRSYGSTIIHSAPNVAFASFPTMFGVSFVAIRATRPILRKDKVCMNYGSGYFKSRGCLPIEIRPKARKVMQECPTPEEERYLAIPIRQN